MNHLATILIEFNKLARHWDDLTLIEQKGYLKRHPLSRRKVTAKLPMKSPGGMAIYEPRHGHAAQIINYLKKNLSVDSSPVWRKYLTRRAGSSNKYHYFAVFPSGNEFLAVNAYGRIGYPIKGSVVIGTGHSADEAIDIANRKLNRKREKRGYEFSTL